MTDFIWVFLGTLGIVTLAASLIAYIWLSIALRGEPTGDEHEGAARRFFRASNRACGALGKRAVRLAAMAITALGKAAASASKARDKGQPPIEPQLPPTEKQLQSAKRLGIEGASSMRKGEVSDAIDRVKARKREEKFGREAVLQEAEWNAIADKYRYILAIYKPRKNRSRVEVLDVKKAVITDEGEIELRTRTAQVAGWIDGVAQIEWDPIEVYPEHFLRYEPLGRHFAGAGTSEASVRELRKTVKRGIRTARKIVGKGVKVDHDYLA